MTPKFYDMIYSCSSLRYAKFFEIHDAHDWLDAVEANTNVKQWHIRFKHTDITDCVKERLQAMLSIRNDNSLIVYETEREYDEIPQTSQQFLISPVSDF